ncbi:ATP-binding cassette domain-containing protein [Paracoccaceae bacterium GXU_MW_L88]
MGEEIAGGLHLDHIDLAQRGGDSLVRLNLAIAPGEILSIMGPSGSGKSTLLNFLIGNMPDDFIARGRVLLFGRDITNLETKQRRIGILFQDDVLFPHLSVAGNLGFGLPADLRGAERRRVIGEALYNAGLEGFEHRDPESLSGGQRARVALMRTLLSQPQALLLDEPFSKLDTDLREHMRHFVFQKAQEQGLPVLMVTHDMDDALSARGRILTPLGKELG